LGFPPPVVRTLAATARRGAQLPLEGRVVHGVGASLWKRRGAGEVGPQGTRGAVSGSARNRYPRNATRGVTPRPPRTARRKRKERLASVIRSKVVSPREKRSLTRP